MIGILDRSSILGNQIEKLSKKSIFSISISLYLGGWSIYYLVSESFRLSTISYRSRKYRLKNRSEGESASESDLESRDTSDWFGKASSAEKESIRQRFKSFSFLGRFQNIASEWREQGLWELVLYKTIFLLQSGGKLWSDGGFTKDFKTLQGREKIEQLLPVLPLDNLGLWGNGYREKSREELASELKEEEIVGLEDKIGNGSPSGEASGTGMGVGPAALDDAISYTWIGQSTCLIQFKGLNILTDPVFQIQPIKSIFSPKRLRPMPCGISEILSGKIDLVLLSHNHFDHLDLTILKYFPKGVKWIVPLGVGKLLFQNGLRKEIEVKEVDWWEEIEFNMDLKVRKRRDTDKEEIGIKGCRVSVTPTPALHWTGRKTPLDTNTSLWCSYALKITSKGESRSLFFSCDTGYSSSLYKSIGRLLGPFDLAIIPIGSYSPRWHMSIQHIDPLGAISIAEDIGAKRSFGVHHGTWIMSEENWHEPMELLGKLVQEKGRERDWFSTTGFGETVYLE